MAFSDNNLYSYDRSVIVVRIYSVLSLLHSSCHWLFPALFLNCHQPHWIIDTFRFGILTDRFYCRIAGSVVLHDGVHFHRLECFYSNGLLSLLLFVISCETKWFSLATTADSGRIHGRHFSCRRSLLCCHGWSALQHSRILMNDQVSTRPTSGLTRDQLIKLRRVWSPFPELAVNNVNTFGLRRWRGCKAGCTKASWPG